MNSRKLLTVVLSLSIIIGGGFITRRALAWNTPIVSRLGNTNTKWLWTGAGVNSLWTNGANWCGTILNGSCTGASSGPPSTGLSALIFDGTCIANANNCTPTGIPGGNLSFAGVHLRSTFTGALNFTTTNLSVGGPFLLEGGTFSKTSGTLTATNFKMTGGTFSGGSGSITFGGNSGNTVVMSGGSFTSTSGTLQSTADNFLLTGLTSFTHNSGLISLVTTGSSTQINPAGFSFYSLKLSACNRTHTLQGPIVLTGNLSVSVSGSSGCTTTINGFSIELQQGNYYKLGGLTGGSTTVKFTGSGQQLVDTTGTNNGYGIPPVVVAQATTGSVKFVSTVDLHGWDDTATLGTIDTNGQTVGWAIGTYNSTAIVWPTVKLDGANSSSYSGFTAATVTDLVLSGSSTANTTVSGSIAVLGNITAAVGSNGMSGDLTLNISGTGAQSIDLSNATTQYLPSIKINKAVSGTLTFLSTPIVSAGFNYVAGSYVAPTTMRFGNGTAGTPTQTFNGFVFNNVEYVQTNNYLFNDNMTISGDLTFSNTSTVSTLGNVQPTKLLLVSGNVSATTSGISGDATIKLVGTSQNIDMTTAVGSTAYIPSLEIASSANVVLKGGISIRGSNFKYTSGTVDASLSTINFIPTSNQTVTHNGLQFHNVGITTAGAAITFAGAAMDINGALNVTSTSATTLGGTLNIYGDIGWGGVGNAGSLAMVLKGTNSSFSKTGAAFPTGLLTVAKNAGQTVTLSTNLALNSGQSLSVTSGSVDIGAASHTLTISGAGTLSLAAGTTVALSGGTLMVGGSSIASGPYSAGMITP